MNANVQTVYVIDDDEDVRDSLVELLDSVGHATSAFPNATEFLSVFEQAMSGCVLADVRMPGMSGIELNRHLNEAGSPLPLIIMTGHGDVSMAVQAMKDGAYEFLQKPFRDQDLLDCVAKALELNLSIQQKLVDKQHIRERIDALTAREREVMDKVLEGKANKVIARELNISDRTVEVHRSHAMEKLGAKSVAEAVKLMLSLDN